VRSSRSDKHSKRLCEGGGFTAARTGNKLPKSAQTVGRATPPLAPNRPLAAVASHTLLLFLSTVYFCIPFFSLSITIFLFFFGWRLWGFQSDLSIAKMALKTWKKRDFVSSF
jgi:hypothetical protein